MNWHPHAREPCSRRSKGCGCEYKQRCFLEPQRGLLLFKSVLTSLGYNLVGDISGCTVVRDATDIISTPNAYLFPVGDNGGSTWTHTLMPGSPALDAGSCTDSEGITVTVDQRGVARPIGLTRDIGAFEAPEYPKFYLTVVMR